MALVSELWGSFGDAGKRKGYFRGVCLIWSFLFACWSAMDQDTGGGLHAVEMNIGDGRDDEASTVMRTLRWHLV